tara:strand:- start:1643 stop:2044 length:402 start_codon:yes stop_codon:yes gene_type:complete
MRLMDLQTIRSNLVENKNNTNMFNSNVQKTIPDSLPIKPVEIDWIYHNNSLNKTFYFSKPQTMKLFVEKLIIKMEKMYHHCFFSVYEYEVNISLTTKHLSDVSRQDTILSQYLDEIYFDIEGAEITIDNIQGE